MEAYRENVIEWLKDEERVSLTITQGRYKTRIERLAKERPDECQVLARNKDGSIFVYIPVSWIRINPGMNLTEEQRQELSERARKNISHTNNRADEME